MKLYSLSVCSLLFVVLTLILVTKSIASLPETTPVPTSTRTLSDDNNQDDDRDHDDVIVEKSASSHIVPSSIIESALRSTVDHIKPLLTRRSSDTENATADTENDNSEYDDEEDSVEAAEPVSAYKPPSNINETIEVLKLWSRLSTGTVETVMREVTPLIVQLSYDIQVSSECAASFLKVVNGLRKQELWAFRGNVRDV